MKKLKSLAVQAVLTLGLLLLTGCQNTVSAMLDDYNSQFTAIYSKNAADQPSPGDPDFVESEMLYSEYYVSAVDTLNLSAPYRCDSYRWVVTDPEENVKRGSEPTELDVVMFQDRDKVSREFVTYIPDSGLQTGKTYKITLTVTKDGKSYSDSAGVVIYKHFDFSVRTKSEETE